MRNSVATCGFPVPASTRPSRSSLHVIRPSRSRSSASNRSTASIAARRAAGPSATAEMAWINSLMEMCPDASTSMCANTSSASALAHNSESSSVPLSLLRRPGGVAAAAGTAKPACERPTRGVGPRLGLCCTAPRGVDPRLPGRGNEARFTSGAEGWAGAHASSLGKLVNAEEPPSGAKAPSAGASELTLSRERSG